MLFGVMGHRKSICAACRTLREISLSLCQMPRHTQISCCGWKNTLSATALDSIIVNQYHMEFPACLLTISPPPPPYPVPHTLSPSLPRMLFPLLVYKWEQLRFTATSNLARPGNGSRACYTMNASEGSIMDCGPKLAWTNVSDWAFQHII